MSLRAVNNILHNTCTTYTIKVRNKDQNRINERIKIIGENRKAPQTDCTQGVCSANCMRMAAMRSRQAQPANAFGHFSMVFSSFYLFYFLLPKWLNSNKRIIIFLLCNFRQRMRNLIFIARFLYDFLAKTKWFFAHVITIAANYDISADCCPRFRFVCVCKIVFNLPQENHQNHRWQMHKQYDTIQLLFK